MPSSDLLGGAAVLASGHSMPLIGLGTSGIKDADQMDVAVAAALRAGYRLFDTAHGYGNEKALGDALRKHLAALSIKREEIFVCTKVPIKNDDTDTVTRAMVDQSIRDLDVGYLDLVLVHYPRHLIGGGADLDSINKQKRRAVYGILEEYVEKGAIRSIGVSNYEIFHLLELADYAKVRCSVNQCEYHPHHTQNQLRAYCKATGVFFQAFASLCSGDGAILQEATVVELAKKKGVTAQSILLAFALSTGVGVLPKSTNPERIEKNLRDTVAVNLTAEETDELLKLDIRKNYVGRCTPWRTI
ncbi:hypothetical protein PFISCL1PPCAC_25638 [Pristionchus fissidentatus]|uniref:NADP-dependent oxidoreductase domain-containing protein n=1 Tax=Pristionchus fissidentatus TaxID=1538716 RepID=A0AAV5WTJ4_9BILA|nr:hypothetical protein PFISCL1PPCAC_25638 [Pristionchus fissidentatus]